jgi:hypothetical protein
MSQNVYDLSSFRSTVQHFARAAQASGDQWTVPRARGKWSPSQVVEHVAMALEQSANDIMGRPTLVLSLPAPLRFVARTLGMNRVVRRGRLFKGKTNSAMNPGAGPATASEAEARMSVAMDAFDAAVQMASAQGDTIHSVTFGKVRLADYIRFQEIHVQHHEEQLPGAEA